MNWFCSWDNAGGLNFIYDVKADFYNADGSLNSTAIKDYMFSYCKVPGYKEFRLDAFKDDEEAADLYTDLTDEDAIEWLFSDPNKLYLLGKSMNFNIMDGNVYYNDTLQFIKKTCFIKGTDESACTWAADDISISYRDLRNISANENGIFARYSNVDQNWISTNEPYFYIVQLVDSDGNLVNIQNKLDLPLGMVSETQENAGRIFLKYSLMDSTGGETGFHHIYYVNLDTGNVTNNFDNVPNRDRLEVVSFSVGGDLLYYSAVRGTSVENGIVNVETNEYNPLTINRKMTAVYALY